jgi:mitogen-activated protein kinase 15
LINLASINSKLASGIIKNTKVNNKKSFEEVFINQNEDLIDFIKKIFVINPKKRMTLEEALNHKYLSDFKEEKDDFAEAEKISFDYTHKFQLEVALFKEKMMMEMMDGK